MEYSAGNEVRRFLCALKLKESVPDLSITFKRRDRKWTTSQLLLMFKSRMAKKGSEEKQAIWRLNQSPTYVNLPCRENEWNKFISDLKNIISIYRQTDLWRDSETLIEGQDPDLFLKQCEEDHYKAHEEEKFLAIDAISYYESKADEIIKELQAKTNAKRVCHCLGVVNALLERLNNENLKQFASLCGGTLRERSYSKELAELKVLTEKIIRFVPELAEFADKFSVATKEIHSAVEKLEPEYVWHIDQHATHLRLAANWAFRAAIDERDQYNKKHNQ